MVILQPWLALSLALLPSVAQTKQPKAIHIRVCEVYKVEAELKARTKSKYLDAKVSCQVTKKKCGRNWRGAQRRVWSCTVVPTKPCRASVCARSDVTATAKAVIKCRKPSCSCLKTVERCSRKARIFDCECP